MLRLATILFLVCLNLGLNAQSVMESFTKQEISRYLQRASAGSKRSNDRSVDLRHVAIAIQPDMSNGYIKAGSVAYTFACLGPLSVFELDLRKPLIVDSVV